MSDNVNLPSLSNEGSLTHYLQQIKKFPMLSQKEEMSLARKWINKGDTAAAHKLVTSHLRLVARSLYKHIAAAPMVAATKVSTMFLFDNK